MYPVQPSEVVEALGTHGFRYIGRTEDRWLRFQGILHLPASAHPCELDVDPAFLNLPRIRLLDVPKQLRPVAAHLDNAGGICYAARGTLALDIFDPIGQTLACLERAGAVLERILICGADDDLEEEFYAYWGIWPCLIDVCGELLGKQDALLVRHGELHIPVITENKKRTLRKLRAFGWDDIGEEVSVNRVQAYRVQTNVQPRPSQGKWPPATVGDLLTWQGLLDRRCRRKIRQRILEADSNGAFVAVILIKAPVLTYGFFVMFLRHGAGAPLRKGKVRVAREQKVYKLPVVPLQVQHIDDRYIAERNNPGQCTVAGKRMALVGCGAIGGYLADMLMKSGVGTGGGLLVLIDDDEFKPQNIGRHHLGFPGLFQNKARALAAELRRSSPGLNVQGWPEKVEQVNLEAFDLIIDATGEEALGHWLAARHGSSCPVLSVWVDGPGIAVRALLHEPGRGACSRCLFDYERSGQYHATRETWTAELAGQGCESLYVPFPAHVSVQAASLGAEIALSWANGDTERKLRTRVTDRRYTLATTDCSPEQRPTCPACVS